MARLVPNPQELLEQIRRLVVPPAPPRNEPTSIDRILDAAHDAFAASGVTSTTMTRIARDAGVSREWLYRQFANRDAVLLAVAQREVSRFIDGLAARSLDAGDLDEAMIDTFVFAVEFLRDHTLLQQILRHDGAAIASQVLHSGPVVAGAVRAGAGYLSALGRLELDDAVVVAEVLVRLVATITFAPVAALDLHDPDQLRRFAAAVVPGVLSAALPQPTASPRGSR